MSRTADHAQRRTQISRAVRELIAEDGLDAVTVARTASRAGISVGLVQHYFATKDDMLLHAYQHVCAEAAARVADLVTEGTEHRRTIAEVLAAAVREHLPLDAPRRAEYRIGRVFAARALDNPDLARVASETADRMHSEVARAIGNGHECGEVAPDVAPGPAATRLLALTQGLATQVYRGLPEVVALALDILDAEISAVFTGTCRQYTG